MPYQKMKVNKFHFFFKRNISFLFIFFFWFIYYHLEQLSFPKKIFCASIAGSIGGAFGNPADLVMVRMQNDAKLPLKDRRNYKHALDGLYRIVKEEGFQGLTRGIGPNVNRAIL